MNRVLLIGLVASAVVSTAVAADKPVIGRLPDNRTLTAEFPSVHTYVIEIWFSEKDKAGTFKAQVFDPSTAGDYDRRTWEDFRTKTNSPGVGTVSRKIELTTRKGVRETEREQIVSRIEREKKLIEKPGLDTVTLPPLPKDKPKADAANKKLYYDESAPKNKELKVENTVWGIEDTDVKYHLLPEGKLLVTYKDGKDAGFTSCKWSKEGDVIRIDMGNWNHEATPVSDKKMNVVRKVNGKVACTFTIVRE